MIDQVQIRKRLSKTDFAYTRWYQLPKGHVLHVVWQNDTHIKVILTKMDVRGVESILTQGVYRYDTTHLDNYIKSLNKYIRKVLTPEREGKEKMKKIRLDIKNIKTNKTIIYLVDCITVINDTLILHSNDNTYHYEITNYEFTIKGSVEI